MLPAQKQAADITPFHFYGWFQRIAASSVPQGALREQKKTSEFSINRRAELGSLNLYPHHELHAEDRNKVKFKLH